MIQGFTPYRQYVNHITAIIKIKCKTIALHNNYEFELTHNMKDIIYFHLIDLKNKKTKLMENFPEIQNV